MCHLGGCSTEGSTVTWLKGGAPRWLLLGHPIPAGLDPGGRAPGGSPWSVEPCGAPLEPAFPGGSREGPVGSACWAVAPAGRERPGSAVAAAPAPIPNKEPMQTQGRAVAGGTRGHPMAVGGTAGVRCSLAPGDPQGHHVAFVPHEDEGTWDTIPGWHHQALCHHQCHHRQQDVMRATQPWDMSSHHPESPPGVGALWVMTQPGLDGMLKGWQGT